MISAIAKFQLQDWIRDPYNGKFILLIQFCQLESFLFSYFMERRATVGESWTTGKLVNVVVAASLEDHLRTFFSPCTPPNQRIRRRQRPKLQISPPPSPPASIPIYSSPPLCIYICLLFSLRGQRSVFWPGLSFALRREIIEETIEILWDF